MSHATSQDLSVKLSLHAKERCKQRSIPPLIVHWLLEYGAEERCAGASKRFFNTNRGDALRLSMGMKSFLALGIY